MGSSEVIKYKIATEAWDEYDAYIREFIIENNIKSICEVGGGANPSLDHKFIIDHGLDYTLLDISADELKKAPECYNKVQADIANEEFVAGDKSYNLVFSKMLAEHVRDGGIFHRNILKILAENGIAFHFFPTLFALPFVINRLIPERLSYWVLNILQPSMRHKDGNKAKFPAYYSWCFGPTKLQMRRLQGLGYKVEKYYGFFGYDGYFKRFYYLLKIHQAISRILVRNPVPFFTSFAWVVLRK